MKGLFRSQTILWPILEAHVHELKIVPELRFIAARGLSALRVLHASTNAQLVALHGLLQAVVCVPVLARGFVNACALNILLQANQPIPVRCQWVTRKKFSVILASSNHICRERTKHLCHPKNLVPLTNPWKQWMCNIQFSSYAAQTPYIYAGTVA